jgi:hypothetical protein
MPTADKLGRLGARLEALWYAGPHMPLSETPYSWREAVTRLTATATKLAHDVSPYLYPTLQSIKQGGAENARRSAFAHPDTACPNAGPSS